MAQLDSAAFAECRENNNHLFKKVRFTREMGNDGDNMVAISEAAVGPPRLFEKKSKS